MQKSSNKKIFKKTIATILVFVMVFQFTPNIVFGIDLLNLNNKALTKEETLNNLDKHLKETEEKAKEKEPVIIGELESERTFTEKHFLMSDGSVIASIFPNNIHYEKDGKFLEIDNILEEITDTKELLKIPEKELIQEEPIDTDVNIENLEEIKQEESLDNIEQTEETENTTEIQELEELEEQEENNEEIKTEDEEIQESVEQINEEVQIEQTNFEEKQNENLDNEEVIQEELNIEKTEQENSVNKETEDKLNKIDTNNIITEKIDVKLAEEIKKETKIYRNKSGNAQITLSNKTHGFNLGSMKSEGHTITWGLLNSKASDIKLSNANVGTNKVKGIKAEELKINTPTTKLEYGEILSNTNIEYSVEPEHIKENIILKNREAINNELKFVYDVGSLKMKLLETKDIIVYDKTEDNIKFTIEAPFMYDGKLEISSNIDIKLEEQDGKYIVTLIPEQEWLEAEERVYPVTIDPSIITSRYYQDIKDTFIYSTQGSNPKGNAHIIRAGNNSGVPTRTLMKFNLPELKAGDQVIGAYLNIFSYPKTSEWTPPTRQIQLDVHKMTADWDENTAIWNTTNTNYASRVEDFILYQFDYNNQCKQYTFNITSVAKEWYTTGNNYGVMIKEHIEANNVSGNDAYFISSDTNSAWYEGRPVVQIIYRNQTGLEDYLSYHVQDLGRSGTVYTNDYNGNLTWLHSDISTPGERFPVTISHVYNTNDKEIGSRYGNGMRLNLSQTVELVTINGVDYAEYIDEDGTRHYFTKEGTYTYKDEDGLGLELTLNTTTVMFEMKDKGDNILRFERRLVAGRYLWHLKEIEDNNGNKVTITFLDTIADQFIITKVTDGAGQNISFQYDGYYLKKLVGPDGNAIEYTYLATGTLTNIKYPDGQISYYDFTENILNAVQKVDGTLMLYGYYPEQTRRVKLITEYSIGATVVGNSIGIVYSNNLTTFIDNKGFSNNVTFNDWGQRISVADYGKDGVNFKDAYGKVYNYGTEGGNKNKLTLDGSLTKSVNNLLMNGSAEYDGEWTTLNWLTNKGTMEYTTEEKYSGSRCFKFKSNYSDDIEVLNQQAVNVTKGKKYTLSAQMKNNGNGIGFIHMYYINSSGTATFENKFIGDKLNDWAKYSLTIEYPTDAASPLYVSFGLLNTYGNIYFDDIQLEEGTVANQYNMIENSGFDYATDTSKNWIKFSATSMWDSVASVGNFNLFRLYGDTSQRKGIYQNVVTPGKAGDTFSVSAWVYGGGTRAKGNTCNTIAINVIAHDNTEQWLSIGINPSDQWQFVQQEFVAKHDYKMIQIYFCFYENVNEAYITNVSLYKDHFGASYQYDSNGNIIKTQDLAKQNNTFQYDGNDNLIKYTNPKGGTFEYQYDTTYKHRLVKAISSTGANYNFTYNQYGQATTSKITNNTNSKYIETNAEYTANGNYLTKIKDELGKETTYEYNQTNGNLNKVTDAKGTETNYTYDTLGRVSTVSKIAGGKTYQNSYTYVDDRINTITHNGFNYSFIYNSFGNRTGVKVGNQTLITNNYAPNNGNLNSVTYGNGQTISYTYDRFNRMTTQTKTQGAYKYEYNAQSNLSSIESPEGIKEYYTYDLSGRLVNANNITNGFKRNYTYDENNNLKLKKYSFQNTTNELNYMYNKNNQIEGIMIDDFMSLVDVGHDALSRIQYRELGVNGNSFTTTFTYEDLENNRTTSRVSSITNGANKISYTYDELGNIKTITEGTTLKATYYYDELSQLIREDNGYTNKTTVYTYDVGGNITSKIEYPYATGELGTATQTMNYTYGNANWKDQLTSYRGRPITYDAMGNLLSYLGSNYTWQNGREIQSIVNEEGGLYISYKYNDEGIRTEKTVNGTTTKYYLEGTKVIYEQTGNNTTYYIYDENDELLGLKYNNTKYWYIKNIQGDIIGILDNNMNQIVSYTYDTFGNTISVKDGNGNIITNPNNIGIINPYRYRSYRYDYESGLYYLNSRYYVPEWGRFLNADGTFDGGYEIIRHNLFAYCSNNPINYYDPLGTVSILSIIKNIGNLISKGIKKLSEPIIATNMAKNTIKISAISNNGGYTRKNIRFSKNLPKEGEPNSTKDLLNPDGTIKQRRYYGPDGKATKDTDYNHPGDKHSFPHDHEWEWDGNNGKRGPAHNLRNLGKGIGIGIGSYALYRGIRMIPSLFPALWWTIPANVATP